MVCEAVRDQILHLRAILLAFEAISRLKVNLSKSPVNSDECIEEVSGTLGCQVDRFPAVYLGLPLGTKQRDQAMWQGVFDRC